MEHLIFALSGFLAGLCVILLVLNKKTYLWPILTGVIMTAIYSTLNVTGVYGKVSFIIYFYIYTRSFMFLAGSLLAAFTYIKVKKQLTNKVRS